MHSCFTGYHKQGSGTPVASVSGIWKGRGGWIDANATRSSSPFNMWRCGMVSAPSSNLYQDEESSFAFAVRYYYTASLDCDGVGFHIIIPFTTQAISASGQFEEILFFFKRAIFYSRRYLLDRDPYLLLHDAIVEVQECSEPTAARRSHQTFHLHS